MTADTAPTPSGPVFASLTTEGLRKQHLGPAPEYTEMVTLCGYDGIDQAAVDRIRHDRKLPTIPIHLLPTCQKCETSLQQRRARSAP